MLLHSIVLGVDEPHRLMEIKLCGRQGTKRCTCDKRRQNIVPGPLSPKLVMNTKLSGRENMYSGQPTRGLSIGWIDGVGVDSGEEAVNIMISELGPFESHFG
jgi:hypothetical protein